MDAQLSIPDDSDDDEVMEEGIITDDNPDNFFTPKGTHSDVWRVFRASRARPGFVKCKKCSVWLPYKHHNTTQMMRHIENRHPDNQQTTLAEFALFPPEKMESLHRSVALYMLIDMRPFNAGEGEGFRQMMKVVQSRYKVGCAATYARHGDELVVELKEKVHYFFHVSIMSDLF